MISASVSPPKAVDIHSYPLIYEANGTALPTITKWSTVVETRRPLISEFSLVIDPNAVVLDALDAVGAEYARNFVSREESTREPFTVVVIPLLIILQTYKHTNLARLRWWAPLCFPSFGAICCETESLS